MVCRLRPITLSKLKHRVSHFLLNLPHLSRFPPLLPTFFQLLYYAPTCFIWYGMICHMKYRPTRVKNMFKRCLIFQNCAFLQVYELPFLYISVNFPSAARKGSSYTKQHNFGNKVSFQQFFQPLYVYILYDIGLSFHIRCDVPPILALVMLQASLLTPTPPPPPPPPPPPTYFCSFYYSGCSTVAPQ